MSELEDLLADHERFHSDFQIDRFIVVRSGGTTWGMYRQALRELESRLFTIRKEEIEIERTEAQMKRAEARGNRARFRRRELALKLDSLRRAQRDRDREFARFLAIAKALKAELGPLDDARKAELEAARWDFEARRQAGFDILSTGRVSRSTIEMIAALPSEFREPILHAISVPETAKQLVAWAVNFEPRLPDWSAHLLPASDARGIACRS